MWSRKGRVLWSPSPFCHRLTQKIVWIIWSGESERVTDQGLYQYLNPSWDDFFQYLKPNHKVKDVWYDNVVVGHRALKMKRLSVEAGLSKVYTNHLLRATTIKLLDIFKAGHVMAISEHKSESSIRNYARTSDGRKWQCALWNQYQVSKTFKA